MTMRADTILKLSLAGAVLLGGAGVGYYFGIFLPGQAIRETVEAGERKHQTDAGDRAVDLERERQAEMQRREAARQRYQGCVATADAAYREHWATGCRAQHERQQAAYDDCADDLFSTRDGCARKFPVEPERGCALPVTISNRLVAERDAARAQCLGEMQGLGGVQSAGGIQGPNQVQGGYPAQQPDGIEPIDRGGDMPARGGAN